MVIIAMIIIAMIIIMVVFVGNIFGFLDYVLWDFDDHVFYVRLAMAIAAVMIMMIVITCC